MNTLCKGCGREVQFANHEKSGKPAPLVRPLKGMKPNIVAYEQGGEWLYHVVSKKDSFAFSEHEPEFVTHFADCKQAAQFRPQKEGQ